MPARLVITGLEELRHVFKTLAPALAEEAEPIIDNRAELAKSAIVQLYPRRTGALRNGVRIKETRSGPYGPGRTVVNRAPHAWLFEYGTEARHTKIGANRGKMPAGRVFIPTALRHKRLLMTELQAMLERQGFVLRGID